MFFQKGNKNMELRAFVKYNPTGETKIIKDSDYSSKSNFANDLRCNEFTVYSISDNRDYYLQINTDYKNLNQLKKKLKFYKELAEKNTMFLNDLNKLQNLYNEVMKIAI